MVSPRETGNRCLGVVDGVAVSANTLSMIQHHAACRDAPRAGFIEAKMECRQQLSKARARRDQKREKKFARYLSSPSPIRCCLLNLADNLLSTREGLDHLLTLLASSDRVLALAEEVIKFVGAIQVLKQFLLHVVLGESGR